MSARGSHNITVCTTIALDSQMIEEVILAKRVKLS